MNVDSAPERPSWRRVLLFALAGGILGAISSGVITTLSLTIIYPGWQRALGNQALPIYAIALPVGGACGAAQGVVRALYGKSVWAILLGEGTDEKGAGPP